MPNTPNRLLCDRLMAAARAVVGDENHDVGVTIILHPAELVNEGGTTVEIFVGTTLQDVGQLRTLAECMIGAADPDDDDTNLAGHSA